MSVTDESQPVFSEDDKKQIDLFYNEIELNKKYKPENEQPELSNDY